MRSSTGRFEARRPEGCRERRRSKRNWPLADHVIRTTSPHLSRESPRLEDRTSSSSVSPSAPPARLSARSVQQRLQAYSQPIAFGLRYKTHFLLRYSRSLGRSGVSQFRHRKACRPRATFCSFKRKSDAMFPVDLQFAISRPAWRRGFLKGPAEAVRRRLGRSRLRTGLAASSHQRGAECAPLRHIRQEGN
jgi:hypothetical protein